MFLESIKKPYHATDRGSIVVGARCNGGVKIDAHTPHAAETMPIRVDWNHKHVGADFNFPSARFWKVAMTIRIVRLGTDRLEGEGLHTRAIFRWAVTAKMKPAATDRYCGSCWSKKAPTSCRTGSVTGKAIGTLCRVPRMVYKACMSVVDNFIKVNY